MHRTFVLINNTGFGGAERRLGRLFHRLADSDAESRVVINDTLWHRLRAAGVVAEHQERVWRLAEPWAKVAGWIGLRHGAVAFCLKKLDYVLFACLLLIRYVASPPRVFHLALGGAYVGLPLMLLRPGHHCVVSVTNRNLAALVGVPLALPLYRFALIRCHGIDALTDGVRADLIQRGIPGEKIVVPPGSVVDAHHFRPAPDRQPWVVFSGRFVEEKNPLLFLEALPTILRAAPSARFFLLGEGPLRAVIDETLDQLHLRHVVEVGFYSDPAPVLSRARVFVSLQRTDNYPSQSLLEAMACGVAVVATDVGLTWQLVDETTGVRVKPDPEEIGRTVSRLLNDPASCDRLGEAARRRVAERHSEAAYRAHLTALYEGLRGSARRSSKDATHSDGREDPRDDPIPPEG